ncbi:MAG: hypothetical protein JWR18_1641 [Segetibacter sp.]|jgi:hypothetical protein|nr:hypothetical protein [Segetibacter sp.]
MILIIKTDDFLLQILPVLQLDKAHHVEFGH